MEKMFDAAAIVFIPTDTEVLDLETLRAATLIASEFGTGVMDVDEEPGDGLPPAWGAAAETDILLMPNRAAARLLVDPDSLLSPDWDFFGLRGDFIATQSLNKGKRR